MDSETTKAVIDDFETYLFSASACATSGLIVELAQLIGGRITTLAAWTNRRVPAVGP